MSIDSSTACGGGSRKKDLRRLPHVYSKVLELPLPADTEVAVFEGPDAFHYFVVSASGGAMDDQVAVRARAVRIHPGVVKVVVVQAAAPGGVGDDDDGGSMEIDRWRSRLPEASCPSMAVAGYVDGKLVVTVPKLREGDIDGGRSRCSDRGEEISGTLVAVQ